MTLLGLAALYVWGGAAGKAIVWAFGALLLFAQLAFAGIMAGDAKQESGEAKRVGAAAWLPTLLYVAVCVTGGSYCAYRAYTVAVAGASGLVHLVERALALAGWFLGAAVLLPVAFMLLIWDATAAPQGEAPGRLARAGKLLRRLCGVLTGLASVYCLIRGLRV